MIKPLLFLIHGVFNTFSGTKKLTFWEISIGANFICFPRNDEKFDFWPWKWGVDLYTSKYGSSKYCPRLQVDASKFNKKKTWKHDSWKNNKKGKCFAMIRNESQVLELTPVEKG